MAFFIFHFHLTSHLILLPTPPPPFMLWGLNWLCVFFFSSVSPLRPILCALLFPLALPVLKCLHYFWVVYSNHISFATPFVVHFLYHLFGLTLSSCFLLFFPVLPHFSSLLPCTSFFQIQSQKAHSWQWCGARLMAGDVAGSPAEEMGQIWKLQGANPTAWEQKFGHPATYMLS